MSLDKNDFLQISEVVNQIIARKMEQTRSTLRDQFAMAALQGVLACQLATTVNSKVKLAYEYADVMLAERERA